MIITRSPLRISLGGGGTDLPSYYRESGGFLIAAAIDKYIYINVHQRFVQNFLLKYSHLEEAATIDGCGPLRTFFLVVLPIMKPAVITVAILEVMWLWNDYLLPYLTLDLKSYKTIPIAVQYLKGGYGSVDMGAMMGVLVLAMIPVIVFYLASQRHIIRGVVAGAVKG